MVNQVTEIDDRVAVDTVLLSVFDKSGLSPFVLGLVDLQPNIRFLCTGGSYAFARERLADSADRHLRTVSDYVGQPELQGGLVKTLDYKLYLGLLSETYNPAHAADMQRCAAEPISMVVCNLYPFQAVVQGPGATLEAARAHIDIGGPAMLRAAAKNFLRVAAVVDPADYPQILSEMKQRQNTLSLATRFRLAAKAFAHTAQYEAAVAQYFGAQAVHEVAAAYPSVHATGARGPAHE